MAHRSKMKCSNCGEHPAWHRTTSDAGRVLDCGNCHHKQPFKLRAATVERFKAESAEYQNTLAWLLGETPTIHHT